MAMAFEELDQTTRGFMLREFDREQASANPFESSVLTAQGRVTFRAAIREAIEHHDEEWLEQQLLDPANWAETQGGGAVVNPAHAAARLSLTEFNTWYTTGFAARLLAEGVVECQTYRAELPDIALSASCTAHEGAIFPVQDVYDGHRAKYWPTFDKDAFSIPFGPSCHHTIRRIPAALSEQAQ
jgi:hypothetical protein